MNLYQKWLISLFLLFFTMACQDKAAVPNPIIDESSPLPPPPPPKWVKDVKQEGNTSLVDPSFYTKAIAPTALNKEQQKAFAIAKAKKNLSTLIRAKIDRIITTIKKELPSAYSSDLKAINEALVVYVGEEFIMPMLPKSMWINPDNEEMHVLLQPSWLSIMNLKGDILHQLIHEIEKRALLKRYFEHHPKLKGVVQQAIDENF